MTATVRMPVSSFCYVLGSLMYKVYRCRSSYRCSIVETWGSI